MNLYRRLSSRLGGSHMRFHRADVDVGGTPGSWGALTFNGLMRIGAVNSQLSTLNSGRLTVPA